MATTTQFIIVGSPVDPAFRGTPQQFFEHILDRMRILAPFGVTTFVQGSQMPATNQGPWLKDGTQWWVWDDSSKTYIPLDISASLDTQFAIQQTQPAEASILFWAQTDTANRVIQFWVKSAGSWYAVTSSFGTTANRPTSPSNYQRYFDTDISCELIYERGQWRTLSGSPGDVKHVTHRTLTEALRYNPGWVEVGSSDLGVSARGRALFAAHKDPGGTPASSFVPLAGITSRAAGDVFGEETHVLTNHETPGWPETHFHPVGRFQSDSNNDVRLIITSSDPAEDGWKADKEYQLRQCLGEGSSNTYETLPAAEQTNANRGIITGTSMQEHDDPDQPTVDGHNTIPPGLALWMLVKQ